MVFAIGDTSGNILAVYRQSDSTVFSLDVAVTKARNVAYFSGTSVVTADKVDMPSGTAVTNRTISFGSQRFFPSGLDFTGIGPYRNILLNDAEPPHYHDNHDLSVTIIKGRSVIHFEDRAITVEAGDVVFIPKGTYHWAENVGDKGCEIHAVFSPAFEGKDTRIAQ